MRDGWTGKSKVLQEVLADLKRENQIVHFHLISVPIAKGKVDITLTTTKLKVPKEIELPGGRREGLDCIKARSRSQTIPIVSAPHVLKI